MLGRLFLHMNFQWYTSFLNKTIIPLLNCEESNIPPGPGVPAYKMKLLSFLTFGSCLKIFCDSRYVPKSSYVMPVPPEVCPEG